MWFVKDIRPFKPSYCLWSYWKNGFWPIIPLLFMVFEYNFRDMFHINGYILCLRTVTLTISARVVLVDSSLNIDPN